MKPGTSDLLSNSREFSRSADNTIYHKGYPVSFRSTGGAPSIQVSLTRDGTRADIDVDYRSAWFPIGLLNGHLTASNSDIRAGTNDARHNNQWSGVQNWWRNLLGLPMAETSSLGDVSGQALPSEPRLKADKPADAVYDFLNGWLVEQKPNESQAYFAEQILACVELEEGVKADRGMVRFAMLQRMMAANTNIGKVSSLTNAIVGVNISNERLKVIQQPHHAQFVLYDVREDLAEEFNCVNRLDLTQVSPRAMKSRSFGKYVGAVFTLKQKDQVGRMVATLWQRERGYWRLISYDVDLEIDRSNVPNVRAQPPEDAPLEYVEGDRDMVRAASTFMKEWLINKNIDRALEYITSECLACVTLYRADDVPAPKTPEEARALLKSGMTRAAEAIGSVRRLDGAIVAPEVHHPALKLVKHADDRAFLIASIPESMADAAHCERRGPDGEPHFSAAPATGYGRYYAAGFSLSSGSADPAMLWIVWSKVNGSWKAMSYALLTP